jgi:hypothetical protein
VNRLGVIVCLLAAAPVLAESRPIDATHSKLTVLAYKSGLFSALAHDHVIRAPIAGGSLSADEPLSVELTVRVADLEVLDPTLAAGKRPEVRARMLSADVLDAARFPEISFRSTSIAPQGADRWKVTGDLSLHGVTKSTSFSVEGKGGRYRGAATLRQSDFGIAPISIAGGTVKVKDEVRIEFEIAAQ